MINYSWLSSCHSIPIMRETALQMKNPINPGVNKEKEGGGSCHIR